MNMAAARCRSHVSVSVEVAPRVISARTARVHHGTRFFSRMAAAIALVGAALLSSSGVHASSITQELCTGATLYYTELELEESPRLDTSTEAVAVGIDGMIVASQKDASLFPESRVRPWVVDNDMQRLVDDALDSLEKNLTLVSPVKDGLGAGPLDHVYRDDQGVDMFLAKLAALNAQETARGSSSPGCNDLLPPNGEVLEDFYRETHGLPPRPHPTAADRVFYGDASYDGGPGIVEDSIKSSSELALSELADDEEGGLANDPDVARLLAKLQEEFDADCSSGSEGEMEEEGREEGKDTFGVRQEDEADAVSHENSPREDGASAVTRRRHDDENALQQQQAGSRCGIDGNETHSSSKAGHCRGRKGQNDGDTTLLGKNEISTATGAASATQSQQGRIDISRIRIDGLGCAASQSGTRSRSAPSMCLSAGGYSRLSRTSTMSAHTLVRAASHRLLEATKGAAEQASMDQKNEAVETPHRAAGSAIVQADDRIGVVRQNAEALQASMSLKRTSYLKSRRPRAVRWRRHETDFPRAKLRSSRRGGLEGTARSSTTDEHQRQRPLTVEKKKDRRRGPPWRFKGSSSTPLLSAPEAALVFGTKEDEVLAKESPSLRQTTLGRMLRRAASLSRAASYPRYTSEHSVLHGHCPSTANIINGVRSSGGSGSREALLDNVLRSKSAFAGPLSATAAGQERLSTAARIRPRSTAAAIHHHERGSHPESLGHGTPRMISPFSERERSILSTKTLPQNHFHSEQATDSPRRTKRERAFIKRPPRSVHKALEMALFAASVDATASPREQFASARKIIADMKQINTRDSVGDLLVSSVHHQPSARNIQDQRGA